jgi:hypothetical protein
VAADAPQPRVQAVADIDAAHVAVTLDQPEDAGRDQASLARRPALIGE